MMKRLQLDSDARRGLSQISLPFAFSILLLAAPLAILLAMSFWTQDFLTLDRTFTLANFKEAWTSPIYRTLMLRSLKISIIVTVLTVGLAYPAAYYMSFVAPNNRKALLVFLITIPFWTSYLMRIFLWKVILGFNGVVNGSLMGLGIIDAPLDWISYNQFAVVLTLSHAWLPFAVLPIFVVMEKVNRSYLEAAQDLGDTVFSEVAASLCTPTKPLMPQRAVKTEHSYALYPSKGIQCHIARQSPQNSYDQSIVLDLGDSHLSHIGTLVWRVPMGF